MGVAPAMMKSVRFGQLDCCIAACISCAQGAELPGVASASRWTNRGWSVAGSQSGDASPGKVYGSVKGWQRVASLTADDIPFDTPPDAPL
jgi:hypothetical protein